MVEDGVGIEEDKIGKSAFAEDAAVRPVEALCGEGSHFADGFGQRQPVFFADEAAEYAGKVPAPRGWAEPMPPSLATMTQGC